ncbi:MAG TPA: TonB family protein [Vicinamibacterales bacterium]|nr:TonB family protein [Vicinamibacterales bacterium]
MYLDLEDYRPDTPRVNRAISVREGILLSLLAHAIGIIVWLLMPPAPPARNTLDSLSEDAPIRYVQMVPPQLPEIAKPRVEQLQKDREASSPDPVPKPDNQPEKITGPPTEKPVVPDTPSMAPPTSAPTTVPDIASKITADPASTQKPAASLGNSLRNLQQFLQTQNFDTQQGGDKSDLGDFQFDAKGVDFNPWLRRFVAQVKRNWFVPQAAMMQRGRVVIQFNVLRNGTITDLRIVQASGIPPFDTAAFNSLKLSNPTIALPADYPDDKAFFTVTFHYNDPIGRGDR